MEHVAAVVLVGGLFQQTTVIVNHSVVTNSSRTRNFHLLINRTFFGFLLSLIYADVQTVQISDLHFDNDNKDNLNTFFYFSAKYSSLENKIL